MKKMPFRQTVQNVKIFRLGQMLVNSVRLAGLKLNFGKLTSRLMVAKFAERSGSTGRLNKMFLFNLWPKVLIAIAENRRLNIISE